MRKLISLGLLLLIGTVGALGASSEALAQGGPMTLRLHITDCEGTPYASLPVDAWIVPFETTDEVCEIDRVTNLLGNTVLSFGNCHSFIPGDLVVYEVVIDDVTYQGDFEYTGESGLTEFIPGIKMLPCSGAAGQPDPENTCCVGPWAQNGDFWHTRH